MKFQRKPHSHWLAIFKPLSGDGLLYMSVLHWDFYIF